MNFLNSRPKILIVQSQVSKVCEVIPLIKQCAAEWLNALMIFSRSRKGNKSLWQRLFYNFYMTQFFIIFQLRFHLGLLLQANQEKASEQARRSSCKNKNVKKTGKDKTLVINDYIIFSKKVNQLFLIFFISCGRNCVIVPAISYGVHSSMVIDFSPLSCSRFS